MRIDGYTRMAAVIAKPIRHSISPFIHNYAYQLTATNAVYLAWEVEEDEVAQSLQQLKVLDMLGANISMPYKKKVLPYLDQVDESAQLIAPRRTSFLFFIEKVLGRLFKKPSPSVLYPVKRPSL